MTFLIPKKLTFIKMQLNGSFMVTEKSGMENYKIVISKLFTLPTPTPNPCWNLCDKVFLKVVRA